jgi:ABC-type amino acid transport substrate-binding protein
VRDTGQEIRITAQREPEAVLADLLEDRVQAVVVDRAVAIGYIRQHPQLAQVGELRDEIPLVIAAHIQAPETIAQVNSALDAFSSDGILRAFEERWF